MTNDIFEKQGYNYCEMIGKLQYDEGAYKIVTTKGTFEDRHISVIEGMRMSHCNSLLLSESINEVIESLCDGNLEDGYLTPNEYLGDTIYNGLKSLNGVDEILMLAFAMSREPSWDDEDPEPQMTIANIDFKARKATYYDDTGLGWFSPGDAVMLYNKYLLKKLSCQGLCTLLGYSVDDITDMIGEVLLPSFDYDEFKEYMESYELVDAGRVKFEKAISQLKSLGVKDFETFKTDLQAVYPDGQVGFMDEIDNEESGEDEFFDE